jgi:hypothetical protein
MTQEIGDFDAFVRQISELDIEISRNEEGVLTVCSTSEPLFCYDANSHEEIDALVQDTIRSYGKHFFKLDLPPFKTASEPIDTGPLPVERATPVSRIKTVFDLAA